MSKTVDAIVLGSTGYVGGELLRLLALHPQLKLRAAVSRGQAGTEIAAVFPHLAGVYRDKRFEAPDAVAQVLKGQDPVAVFSALPHGESAPEIAALLRHAGRAAEGPAVVDISADLRLDAALYAQIYGHAHPAPELFERALCALPEHVAGAPSRLVAHPGCFTTAVTLAARPLLARGLAEPWFHVSAVTGSTGAGREPTPSTHHPFRHANVRAYQPLSHRHEPEMRRLLGRGLPAEPEVSFVPHSGPFTRGIHATLFARLTREMTSDALRAEMRNFYAGAPFIGVVEEPPALKDVVGTNRCTLFAQVRGRDAVVLSVIDNLTKGAAGGAVQWMNRILGFEETAGLLLPGLGWS